MRDKHGTEFTLGDILDSDDGYAVIVADGWVGKQICQPGHSCEHIPYALNNGRGYTLCLNRPCGLIPADGLSDGGDYYTEEELTAFDAEELDKTSKK